MTMLGDAVKELLDQRGAALDSSMIEKTLQDAGIASMASRGVPARLRVRRLHVLGTKVYAANKEVPDVLTTAPITLDWSPADGVNGVGTGTNLRGKSSVLLLTLWAMTGRCHVQKDVRSWADEVHAEFTIDGVPLSVDFAVDSDGEPTGSVTQQVPSGRAVLGSFRGSAEFESLMGSVMLDRLRLDVIPVFSQGIETEHLWPSYAAALTVHANQLDPIVGNENTLKTRVLQMFLGTGWAAIDAQAATALNALEFEQARGEENRHAAASVNAKARARAEDAVAVARAELDHFDPVEPDVEAVLVLTETASDRAREVQDLSLELMNARTTHEQVLGELHVEELRRLAAEEDAVARRLFNGMTPSACPRCSATVTPERYAAETTTHECSLCSADLDLDLPTGQAASDGESDGPADTGADALVALRSAVVDSESALVALETRVESAVRSRKEAEAAARRAHAALDSARARLQAEIRLARAEGALAVMEEASQVSGSPPGDQDHVHRVLTAARHITKQWVKEDQDPLLVEVSAAITTLARSFGATNISAVRLKGNGNMDVEKGGTSGTYSGLTNGEKLRIKLATAIAL